ncbi:MAG TPA: protoporphyrinogen oxidase [Ilumatobacteraceae bacterium]|nr:protoporphyrinogen oxidase [Ilumatobacteraceae bacterium]HRB02583.1 protoporphyrinogen oxidase [Ilumatobacteraceae bacterium]
MSSDQRRVAVVGGGIAGLAAAHALVTQHDAEHRPSVVVFERDSRFGGKLRTSPFAGHPAIDEGADAFLARIPWATQLAQAVGLGDQLVSPDTRSAAVWWNALHAIPEGLLLGMPTEILALTRSSLLSWPGKFRAASEPFRRRTSLEPDSLGQFVRARFGHEVHHRLVDPLVGSIYAANTDHFSLAAVPQIADIANRGRSVLITGRRMPKAATVVGPVFQTPNEGMGALAAATAAAVVASGGALRSQTSVDRLEPDGSGWRVNEEYFDGVILAAPASAASRLLVTHAPQAAGILAAIPTADVALVALSLDAADWPANLAGMSGYLVPKPMQRLVTAASFGSQKWAHWATPGTALLRISLGRDGLPVLHLSDDQLLAAAVGEVGEHLGIALQPLSHRITRWPGAFPQYRPHHAVYIETAQRSLPAGIALAGASYHGIGVPACIRSGQQAAEAMYTFLNSVAQ